MYCSNCGREIEENVAFCPNCGQAVNVKRTVPNVEPMPYEYTSEPVKSETDGYAIASLVLGILAFFCLPIVGSILAIVFGNKSMCEHGQNTMAKVGKILGIVSLVIMIVCVVIIIIVVVVFGVGMMSSYYYM